MRFIVSARSNRSNPFQWDCELWGFESLPDGKLAMVAPGTLNVPGRRSNRGRCDASHRNARSPTAPILERDLSMGQV